MMKRAFIVDLDNTVFPVPSIGEELFKPLFEMIAASEAAGKLQAIKHDVMRKPFQWVAKRYNLDEGLTTRAIEVLKTLKYEGKIAAFDDFHHLRNLPGDKFIVTTGFINMQQSKVKGLQLEKDFKEIFIIDPTTTGESKKNVFEKIMNKYAYKPEEVLVIGDDPESEIKAANELGIDSVLYDRENSFPEARATFIISDYLQLVKALGQR
jgi:putative hydrolase of the HAD superfamily